MTSGKLITTTELAELTEENKILCELCVLCGSYHLIQTFRFIAL
jgi:hypothetical protein